MAEVSGGLEVAVGSIVVGARHRADIGDLDALASSIEEVGLLQPITITPERTLLCGLRRLRAVERLGWDTVRVWVRSGLSEGASALFAERDENTLRKEYSPMEKEALYREIKELLSEDAMRRKQAAQFGADAGPGSAIAQDETDNDGGVTLTPPPESDTPGRVREQAARIVTGRKSQNTLERIGFVRDVADDVGRPDEIRHLAAEARDRIDAGHPVFPEYERVRSAVAAASPEHQGIEVVTPHDVEEILTSLASLRRGATAEPGTGETDSSAGPQVSRASLRQWVMTWRGLDGWSARYDPAVVGPAVSDADWQVFEKVLTETTAFARAGRAARAGGAEKLAHLDNQTLFDAVEASAQGPLASVTPIGEHR